MTRQLILIAAVFAIGACSHPAQIAAEPEFLSPNGPSRTPYSPVVLVGNLVFVSGQVGLDASGKLVPGGIQTEARQALNNLKTLLEKSGSSLDRAVKCTVFLADMGDYAAMNEIYATYFTNHKPARSAVGVAGLPFNARIAIECTAVGG
jgi:2-iminobutanoate/2-iminopropanoate deaminase